MTAIKSPNRDRRDTYFELVKEFPLVSIPDEESFVRAQQFVDHLLQIGKLDRGQEDYLDALSDLIGVYEDKHYQFPSVSLSALLEHLMDAKGVKQAAVAESTGIPRSTISEILRGKRKLSLSHIGPLSKFFRVPASVFLTDDIVAMKSSPKRH